MQHGAQVPACLQADQLLGRWHRPEHVAPLLLERLAATRCQVKTRSAVAVGGAARPRKQRRRRAVVPMLLAALGAEAALDARGDELALGADLRQQAPLAVRVRLAAERASTRGHKSAAELVFPRVPAPVLGSWLRRHR